MLLTHENTIFFSNQKAANPLKDWMPSYLQSFSLTYSQSKVAHTCMHTHFLFNPSLSPDLLPCFNSGNSSLHFVTGLPFSISLWPFQGSKKQNILILRNISIFFH